MIPKYRHMHYTDEGCDLYQCLSCYSQMEFRYCPKYNYCPVCGVKWEGQLKCRNTYTPRWIADLNLDEDEEYNLRTKAYYANQSKRCWIIEKRTIFWRGDEKFYTPEQHPCAQGWHTDYKYENKTAKQILHILSLERADQDHDPDWDFGSYDEFRARIGDK